METNRWTRESFSCSRTRKRESIRSTNTRRSKSRRLLWSISLCPLGLHRQMRTLGLHRQMGRESSSCIVSCESNKSLNQLLFVCCEQRKVWTFAELRFEFQIRARMRKPLFLLSRNPNLPPPFIIESIEGILCSSPRADLPPMTKFKDCRIE